MIDFQRIRQSTDIVTVAQWLGLEVHGGGSKVSISPGPHALSHSRIMEAMVKGTKRYVKSEENPQKRAGRASDEELFARLIFYGVTLLGWPEHEVWLMPHGALLDQWEVYKQFQRIVKPAMECYIDNIVPLGV